jgi:class 3 adenylate cyclase/tetratricopeptide (TPR) repeat protein
MPCPNCGTENPEGAKFCNACGDSLLRVCSSCGTSNASGARFCSECGASVAIDVSAATPVAAGGTPQSTPAAERRLVSVLFADLVGFTTLSESRDSEEVRELLSRYFDTCSRLIGLYGGTVEKFIGDAVMAVWGTPTATEDDPERAVRAALDLVAAVSALGDELGAPELQARAGVLTGEAAVTLGAEGQGMVAGDLVNTASRVQSVADPGTVLVGESTRRATEQTVVFEEAGEHELKGKQGRTPLWRALRVVSGVRGQLKSDGLEAPFVGRERELRQVKELFHVCAEEKKAQLVSITGIAGIGKSRLAWEFYKYFDGIVETIWWHRGRCLAYGEGVTYWALADMVRMRCRIAEDDEPAAALKKLQATLAEQMLDPEERRFMEPGLVQLLGLGESEDGDRQELFAAWRLFFERLADSNPTVLVFEDLQWADASLLDFVEYLLEWSRSYPLYVVTLARPELLEQRPTWGAGQRSFSSLHLEPLSDQAMEELLRGLVPGLPEGLTAQILTRAEGVPLYAVETVRMLLDRGLLAQDGSRYRVVGEVETLEVPETLQALIAARLDGLSDEERRLLQNGAVLGKTFSRQALAALTGLSEPELEPLLVSLVRKEVLSLQADPRSPEHGQYGFLQDLVRRVAYDTLAKRERKSRHLAAADHLAVSLGEEEVAEVIAAHLLAAYQAAPDADDAPVLRVRAGSALVRAGERTAALAAAAEAQRYFNQAAELTDDPLTQAELTDRAGQMAWRAGKPVDARTLLDDAQATYEEQDDTVAAARIAARLAEIDFSEGHPRQAVTRLAPALDALEAAAPDADVAALAAQLGRFLIFSGDYERAAPHLERALSLAEALDLPETLAQALNSKSVLTGRLHRPRETRILVEGALAIALEHDLHAAALRAYNNLLVTLWQTDKWREQLATSDRALELARRIGDRNWEANFLAGSIGMLSMLGRWDEALDRAAQAEELAATEFAQGLTLSAVPIHVHRGSLDRARELLARHAAVGQSENPDFAAGYATAEGVVLASEGRPEDALAAAERGLTAHSETGGAPSWILFSALEAAATIHDGDKIRELLRKFDELPPGELTPSLRAQQARFRARFSENDAEGELATAERLFRELQAPFYLAVTQLEHAEWLTAQDRSNEAQPLLAQARQTFEKLQATPWLERTGQATPFKREPETAIS